MEEELKARRRRLMQDELARIGVELFLQRGYEAVTVDEIATAADMSQRTFFRYFATKEDLLRRYRRSLVRALVRALEQRPDEEPPVAALRAAYLTTSHVDPADRSRVQALGRLLLGAHDVWAKEQAQSIFDPGVVAEVERRMGVAAGDLRASVVAAAVSAAATAGWDHWVRSDGRDDPADAVAAAIDLLGLTVGARGGR